MNKLSMIRVQNKWRPEVFYSTFAIDGIVINEWLAQYTDNQSNSSDEFSDSGLSIALDLYDHAETEAVWQYLGLPENRAVTYVPILTCPDDMDLDCTVRIVEQCYDENLVYWERFGALIDDLEKQNAEAVEWFIDIPRVVFDRDNFIQVFGQLNSEISKEYCDRGEQINIPFPAKPIKEEWEKIVDSWF
ncbi:MAG: hypothetical protein L0G25_02410 [Psychrobacter sp.]|nr:hypothetical protein [Psychrobacter sp.]